MLHKRIIALLLVCLLFLAGCGAPIYNQTENNVADVKLRQQAVRTASASFTKPAPPLVVNRGLYVDKTPISLARQPAWLLNRIVIRGTQLPFSYYSRTVVGSGPRNIMIHYQQGLDQALQISMNYTGTIKGALDMLASKTGYIYYVAGNHVYWQAFVTRTFDIAFMPGASDYMMGKAAGGGTSSQATATGAPSTGIIDDSAASQYSNLKGTISIWKDLNESIKQMLSPDGTVVVSEATTSVTVRDRPANVNLVARFISNINNKLSQQVLVKVQLLDVRLENDYNFGINWSVIQGNFTNQAYQLVSNNGIPIALSALSPTGLSGQMTIFGAQNNSGSTGVTTLINSLKQQGKVSLVTEPMVLAQNNQVSVIRLIQQNGYLASVQTTTLAGSSTGGQITSQITPGSVVTGLTLYVLPKIMGNKVYLQINGDLSSNQGIKTITSNGATPGTPAATNASIIQVPDVQQKQFNQRTMVCSGDTLILSGFRQTFNSAGAQQLFDSQTLGGRSASQFSLETIILITPVILHGTA